VKSAREKATSAIAAAAPRGASAFAFCGAPQDLRGSRSSGSKGHGLKMRSKGASSLGTAEVGPAIPRGQRCRGRGARLEHVHVQVQLVDHKGALKRLHLRSKASREEPASAEGPERRAPQVPKVGSRRSAHEGLCAPTRRSAGRRGAAARAARSRGPPRAFLHPGALGSIPPAARRRRPPPRLPPEPRGGQGGARPAGREEACREREREKRALHSPPPPPPLPY
jgi:hypothetical protein